MTSNDIVRGSMHYLFDRMDEAGCFKQPVKVPTAYDKAVAAQREAKERGEKK